MAKKEQKKLQPITPEYLKKIRAFWGLHMYNISQILGFSHAQWRHYESLGKIPSKSHQTLIRLAEDVSAFKSILENCDEDVKKKLGKKYARALKIANETTATIDAMIEKKRNEYYRNWISAFGSSEEAQEIQEEEEVESEG